MSLYWVAILMTVGSNVVYHVAQRATNPRVDPLVSLLFTYVTAALCTLAAIPLFGRGEPWREAVAQVNWAAYLLGAGIVVLELGFLLAYRAGWNITLAAVYSNVAVGLLLLPVGVFFFGERPSPVNLAGVGFALVGIWLMSRR